jgi:mannose-6-phosphate isomerase-like protein (cupin superfamily)
MDQRAAFFQMNDWKWVFEGVDLDGNPYVVFEGPENQKVRLGAPHTRQLASQIVLKSFVPRETPLKAPLPIPLEVCANPFLIPNICTIHELVGQKDGLGFSLTLLDQLRGTHFHYQLEAIEILTGINGITEVIVGSEKYFLKRGDVLVLPPGAVYQMHGHENARCLSLLVPAWTPSINFTLPEEECPNAVSFPEKEILPADPLHLKSWLNAEQIQGIPKDIQEKVFVKQEHDLGFELSLQRGPLTNTTDGGILLYALGDGKVIVNERSLWVRCGDVITVPPKASLTIDEQSDASFLRLSFLNS